MKLKIFLNNHNDKYTITMENPFEEHGDETLISTFHQKNKITYNAACAVADMMAREMDAYVVKRNF